MVLVVGSVDTAADVAVPLPVLNCNVQSTFTYSTSCKN